MRYEIQQHTPADGWINNWLYDEGDGVLRAETFATAAAAEAALAEYLRDLEEEMTAGTITHNCRYAFRIRSVRGAARNLQLGEAP